MTDSESDFVVSDSEFEDINTPSGVVSLPDSDCEDNESNTLLPAITQVASSVQQAEQPSSVQQAEQPSSVQQAELPSSVQQAELPSSVQQVQLPSSVQQAELPSSVQQADQPKPTEMELNYYTNLFSNQGLSNPRAEAALAWSETRHPTRSPVFVLDVGMNKIAWCFEHADAPDRNIYNDVYLHSNCRSCSDNIRRCHTFSGPQGPLLFHGVNLSGSAILYNARKAAEKQCKTPHTGIILVTNNTFPKFSNTNTWFGNTFHHFSVKPSDVTSPEMITRMEPLMSKYLCMMTTRMQKVLSSNARQSLDLIFKEMKKGTMKRPEHWTSTQKWIQNIHEKYPKDWEDMTIFEQSELLMFALATGEATNDVHFNYQKMESLIDVMFANTPEAAIKILDDRTNPTTYMVSAVAQKRATLNVKGDNYVGLQWYDYHDLDLYIEVMSGPYRGKICYFGEKEIKAGILPGLVLDFDAGRTPSADGTAYSECTTVHEAFTNYDIKITVSLFSRRKYGTTIPFQVIVAQHGEEKIYENSFSSRDGDRTKIDICTVVFTKRPEEDLTISEARRKALVAQSAEFQRLFGDLKSTVATASELKNTYPHVEIRQKPYVPPPSGLSTGMSLLQGLMRPQPKPKPEPQAAMPGTTKTFLSDRMAQQIPTSMEGFMEWCKTHQMKLEVPIEACSPAYVTKLTGHDLSVFKSGKPEEFSLCAYVEKNQNPTYAATQGGTARCDGSWFLPNSLTYHGTMQWATVKSIVKKGDTFFLILEGMKMSQDNFTFPKTVGTYPTSLSTSAHEHRSAFALLNVGMPEIPDESEIPDKSELAIGVFPNGPMKFMIDGNPDKYHTVSV